MTGKEIRRVFEKAGVAIPDSVDVSCFDDTEDWCCGYWAEQSGEEVILQQYCLRGRGGSASVSFIRANGEVTLEYPISSFSTPGEFDKEEEDLDW